MLHFELVTPEKLVRTADVHMVVVPGTDGEFGVLEGHAPFMSTIRDGVISVYTTANGTPETIAIRGGFAEVNATSVTVLAQRATPATTAPGMAAGVAPDALPTARHGFAGDRAVLPLWGGVLAQRG